MSLVTIDAAGANLKKGSSQTTVCDNYHYEICNNFYFSPTKSSLSQLNIVPIKGRHVQSHAVLGCDGLWSVPHSMKANISLPTHRRGNAQRADQTSPKRRMLWIVLLLAVSFAGYMLYFPLMKGELHDGAQLGQQPGDESATKSHPSLKHMIQSLPSKLLPETGKHRHNGRLVIVGDVHGMKDSLVTLLAKIDFDKKHDHLVSSARNYDIYCPSRSLFRQLQYKGLHAD